MSPNEFDEVVRDAATVSLTKDFIRCAGQTSVQKTDSGVI